MIPTKTKTTRHFTAKDLPPVPAEDTCGELISVSNALERLGITAHTLYKGYWDGKLPLYYWANFRSVAIRIKDLDQFALGIRKNKLREGDEAARATRRKTRSNAFIYLFESQNLYKIGFALDVNRRLKQVQFHAPSTVTLICCFRDADARQKERELHQRFQDKRRHGEWFALSPEDVTEIQAMAQNDQP